MLECIRMGAAGYVEKPLRPDDEEFMKEFATAVEDALEKGKGRAGDDKAAKA